ncbi:MAG TPA: hypothetical protein VHS08_07255, partial [Candidatus Acidoferrales bacterium]|nr:hypothetical protein [Candidatus Acidoferrales bacterium]
RKYEEHLPKLKETGCLFVISAVESANDGFLAALEKGHTRADFFHVAATFRALNLTLHPTFVPFSPLTTVDNYVDLLRVLYEQHLTENVAPIQLGIRLLIPAGSRMLELEEIRRVIGPFDPHSLVYPWRHVDSRVDALSETVQQIAAAADRDQLSRAEAFERIWVAAHQAAGISPPTLSNVENAAAVPFLSEPWYCCAEPTTDQLVSIGRPKPVVSNPTVSADSFV